MITLEELAKELASPSIPPDESWRPRIIKLSPFIVSLDPAYDRFWGGYSGYVQDPDGHLWEMAWNPAWVVE